MTAMISKVEQSVGKKSMGKDVRTDDETSSS